MPFSELLMFSKGKVDSTQQRTSILPSDLSFQGHSDCCELVWDQRQVIMRNQSNKERKGSSSTNLPSIISKPQDAKNSKPKFSSIDSVLNDFPLSAPPCDMTFDEDDNTVPWVSCPVVEPFNNVYSPDILPESFGVTANEFAQSNNSTAKLNRLGDGQTSSNSTGMKLQKNNNAGQPNNSSRLMNFSYFARFASNSKQTNGIENKGSGSSSHNHMESTFVHSSAGFSHQESGSNAKTSMLPSKTDSILPEQSVARRREPDGKAVEPAVASSSVSSGNSLERDSNNPPSSLKRKCFETGDSEGPSDEVEDESVGVRKTASNRSCSKRSRAAEVHNQSERRRRERINEKMRTLQELIPNCNKVDKASMLDEAIEYLKTLQLQVQILSMGTGMYMSQMMLPAAMQHMYRTHMSQFSPMGFGMGAAFGFGMNMPDMNSMMQMPSSFPVSGLSGFNGVNSSSQVLGHLGHGMRLPMGNISGMPLANNSLNQGPNQETMVLNEAENATGLSNIKHSC